jgi:UDP-N-acetylglucosamine--N-acetylmuramyl-(pentapeptide) pyrophosphoryl-undecaprenol N-acetylglucosamine transferase
VKFFFLLFVDTIASAFILASYRPDVVAGFGGYISWPVIVMASVFRIPKVVHEQNVAPGRANKFLSDLADRIAISFNQTKKYLGRNEGKAVFTGNPIRDSIFKDDKPFGIRRFGLSDSKFTILVVGGSQGASGLNSAFVGAVEKLDQKTRESLQVIHITGVKDYESVSKKYELISLDNRTHSFVDRIEDAYSASDLIVTRSGASALFEAAFFGRPMVLVPYPYAMSHQKENAKVFVDGGAALSIEEKTLSPDIFKDMLQGLMKDKPKLREMGNAAKTLSVPDASDRMADVVLNISRS